MTATQYIAYYRVSTGKQGASGLGLDAQRTAVQQFAGVTPIIAEYTEVESGKQNARPQLIAAIAHAKQIGATLLIAKLDRLSRNAGFIFALRDTGVEFVAADLPDANTLTIGIFATLAQHERELISQRTKAALTELKRKGKQLGTPQNLTNAHRALGNKVQADAARNAPEWQRAKALASSLQAQGHTLRAIAEQLNAAGFCTRTGKPFHATQVQRALSY